MEFSIENHFSYYEKCRNVCAYWAYFKVSLNGYDESAQCLLTKNEKKNFNLKCLKSQNDIFLNFDTTANKETIFYLKRRVFVSHLAI